VFSKYFGDEIYKQDQRKHTATAELPEASRFAQFPAILVRLVMVSAATNQAEWVRMEMRELLGQIKRGIGRVMILMWGRDAYIFPFIYLVILVI